MKKNISRTWICIGRISLFALFCAVASSAIAQMFITGNPNERRYSRFYSGADKAFIGDGLDFSGVSTNGPWATMISPQYFITAYHWPATSSPSGTLAFCEGNSMAGGTHTYHIDTSFGFSTTYEGQPSDVYVGRLTAPIPASDHIAYYPVLSLPNLSDYVGRPIYNYGNWNQVGRNVISSVAPYSEGIEKNMGMFFNYDAPGVGPDETYLINGDSGAPSFAVVDGRLALLGEHFSTYGTSGLVPYDLGPPKASDGSWWSVDGFLPAYIAQIDGVLPPDQQLATVVPEPGTALLLIVAMAILSAAAWQRRQRAA
jgi:hypothetical protein